MSIESLKEQARRHEQKEEWRKALDLYGKAIAKLEEEDQPDIGLYNRLGDLYVRVGNLEEAVKQYEEAINLYVEAELPNNAIGVCKKIIRNLPNRHATYLRMGQIRARQGFISDARTLFLSYAERMQQAGDLDESFRALVEFADLAPEDVSVRRAVADSMAAHDRVDDAIDQLAIVHRTLMLKGEEAEAQDVEARLRQLSPDLDLSNMGGEQDLVVTGSSLADDDAIGGSFNEIELGGQGGEHEAEQGEDEETTAAIGGFESGHAGEPLKVERSEPLPTFGLEDEEEEEEAEPLPMLDTGSDEEEAEPLPVLDTGADDEEEEEAEPLPVLDTGADDEEEEEEAEPLPMLDIGMEEEEAEAEPLPTLDVGGMGESGARELSLDGSLEAREAAFEEAAREAEVTLDTVRDEIAARPDDLSMRQRFVELAYQGGDERVLTEAYLGLADALRSTGETARAKAAYQQALRLDPSNETALEALQQIEPSSRPVREVASSEDYVDLGSMILGDQAGQKSTRFVVAYEEPSGDEQADFAKMLNQFKAKVSENLDTADVKSHYDLGTAYKEMGLLDEAVAEFQQALRGSGNHLPTYELLGQTFLELGKPEAAVRSLERALEAPFEVEDERIGIYYYLARAHEQLGQKDSALEYYDQVFSLDINFADVTERLRALR